MPEDVSSRTRVFRTTRKVHQETTAILFIRFYHGHKDKNDLRRRGGDLLPRHRSGVLPMSVFPIPRRLLDIIEAWEIDTVPFDLALKAYCTLMRGIARW